LEVADFLGSLCISVSTIVLYIQSTRSFPNFTSIENKDDSVFADLFLATGFYTVFILRFRVELNSAQMGARGKLSVFYSSITSLYLLGARLACRTETRGACSAMRDFWHSSALPIVASEAFADHESRREHKALREELSCLKYGLLCGRRQVDKVIYPLGDFAHF
jgi:hypothetical protein